MAQESFVQAYTQAGVLSNSPATQEQRARACRGLGQLLQYETPQQALIWLQRGLTELAADTRSATDLAYRSHTDIVAWLHILVSSVQDLLGNSVAALGAVEEALALLLPGPNALRANALLNLGNIYSAQGLLAQSSAATLEALAISTHLHDHFLTLKLLHNQGIDKETAGDWPGAVADYQQALALAEEQGNRVEEITIKNSLGILQTKRGDDEAAHTLLTAAVTLARQANLTVALLYSLTSLADLQIQLRAWSAVAPLLDEAEQLALAIDHKRLLPIIFYSRAQYYLAGQEFAAAQLAAAQAVTLAHDLEIPIEEGIGYRVLALTQLATNQIDAALAAFAQSQSLLDGQDPYELARTRQCWGQHLLALGKRALGNDLLHAAQRTFQSLGARRNLANIEPPLRS